MPAYTNAIADIGETLISLLKDGFKGSPDFEGFTENSIILSSPGEIGDNGQPKLCLFLYQISENAHMKNREMQRVSDSRSQYPPLMLDLHYQLVPYSSIEDRTDKTKEEHKYLSKAMQIFYDNAMLRDPVLKGGLTGRGLQIRLTYNPVPLDELIRLWQSFQTKPFRPSVCYLVSPVELESARVETVSRVIRSEVGGYG